MVQYMSMNNMIFLFVLGIATFLLSLTIMPLVIDFVKSYDLMDKPNHRKLHKEPTPSMGGVGIIISSLATSLVACIFMDLKDVFFILIVALGFCVLGFLDDWKDIKALYKLFFQIAFAIACYLLDFKVDDFHGFIGLEQIPEAWSFIVTLGLIILILNAYNLIDGIDTLAGGIIAINLGVFLSFFLLTHQFGFALFSAIILGGVMGFLMFNLHPAKIFMGDSGSLPLGAIMVVFSLKALNVEPPTTMLFKHAEWVFPLVVALNAIPFIDTFRVFLVRILNGTSPFTADKNHLHHLFLKNDLGHIKSALYIQISHLSLIILSVFIGHWLTITLSIVALLLVATLLFEWTTLIRVKFSSSKLKSIKVEREEMLKENKFLERI